jgi:ribosomal protein S12 methylthiotransferase
VGFPGETEHDFEKLLELLEEVRFDRVGAFAYSAQEGTHAASMDDDVHDAVKRERLERLTELQRAITAERYEARIGSLARLIVDRATPSGQTLGRLPWQADDVDGVTIIDQAAAPGDFLDVRVEDVVDDYDFRASVMRRIDQEKPRMVHRRPRVLPMAGSAGSYGR